jgi:hypothetical protein
MEMEESPEVAIIQHASGVMNVTNSWFENAITYFTNLIYAAVRFAVGNGDVAPFIGHNAFLRWKAIQSIKFTSDDGRELFWSENHVSEDFDVALRLQAKGFVLRLATYGKHRLSPSVFPAGSQLINCHRQGRVQGRCLADRHGRAIALGKVLVWLLRACE